MKNLYISIQLLVLMLIGTVGLFFFSTIGFDKYLNNDELTKEIEFTTGFGSFHDEQLLADRIFDLADENRLLEIISLSESYNFKMALYIGHSRPVYNNLIYNNMSYSEERTADYFAEEGFRYTLYLICDEMTVQHKPVLYAIAPIWKYVQERNWLINVGTVAGVLFIVLGIILMSKYGTGENKIWVYLSEMAAIEFGIVLLAGAGGMKRILVLLICEKIFAAVISYIILYRLKMIHGKAQKIAADNENSNQRAKIKSFSLKEFEHDMESVSDYVSEAVESRMKSERLRTELITNVSHDLKTPLTSVINFSDLINKEAEPDTAIAEYADHLHKQSIRLKELLDALLDASKAASGALEVHMEPCNVHTLLEQCVIEYEDRLAKNNIELIEKYPEEDVKIMADVRFLHRIFENILINICKYSLPGTRAYINAKVENGRVNISFKNVSREQLDISADELTERFVRGDKSRHSEGHGLGLSVVSSLMELQNARMNIEVNADLFVISLYFTLDQ